MTGGEMFIRTKEDFANYSVLDEANNAVILDVNAADVSSYNFAARQKSMPQRTRFEEHFGNGEHTQTYHYGSLADAKFVHAAIEEMKTLINPNR